MRLEHLLSRDRQKRSSEEEVVLIIRMLFSISQDIVKSKSPPYGIQVGWAINSPVAQLVRALH